MHVPVNRWTVGLLLALVSWIGGDLWSSVAQVASVIATINSPAM